MRHFGKLESRIALLWNVSSAPWSILSDGHTWTGRAPPNGRDRSRIEEEQLGSVKTPADDAADLLVVDDDTAVRMLVRRSPRENGSRVTTAGDAADARRTRAGLEIDLLVVDV